MPIYMDVHNVPGVKAMDVAHAHRMDTRIQDEHHCKCITYWLDEDRGNIFCLIEAPSKEAVSELHSKAHGLIPNKVIEVNSNLVGSFLGRIYDPVDAMISEEGLKVFEDSGFRILLLTKIADPVLLKYKFGESKTQSLLEEYSAIVRKNLQHHDGREVEERGPGFVASFSSATKAVSCALAIQKELSESLPDLSDYRLALNSGEPVEKSDELFGETIQLAEYLCHIAKKVPIVVSSSVEELIANDFHQERKKRILSLTPHDESLLSLLFDKLNENWQNPDFNVTDYCQSIAMSKSQLYRKTISLCGLSPVLLLKEFRLEKAKQMMKKQRNNISEITFNSGFTSPSYFTKCFKKKYGLLPMTYMDLLH
jgi:AraC-like DNA-binding protein